MSKANYVVDSKELERLRKKAERVSKILEKIEALKVELEEIQGDSKWLRYLGHNSTNTLTDNEKWELNDICEVIFG